MSRSAARQVAAALVVSGLVLAGCAKQDSATGSGSESGGATSSTYFSPLEEFLNPGGAEPQRTPQDYEAMDKQLQELVAACMADQGFEYIAFTYPSMSVDLGGGEEWGTRAWIAKYGYGLSTFDAPSGPETNVTDPNQAIVDAMSQSERDAYYVALFGGGMYSESTVMETESAPSAAAETAPQSEGAPSAESTDSAAATTANAGEVPAETTGETAVSIPEVSVGSSDIYSMPPLEEQGCYGKAQKEVYGDDQYIGEDMSEFESMWNAYSALYDEVSKDPALAATVQEWVGCMTNAGYPGLSDVEDAQMQANDKWSELNGWDMAASVEGGGVVAEATGAAKPSEGEPQPASPEEIAQFRDYEIKIALADYDCQEQVGYRKLLDEIRIAKETQFVEEHRAELERYRDIINGASG